MPYPDLDIAILTARARPIYRCVDCGSQAQGDSVTIELREIGLASAGAAAATLARARISNSHMPVGWAGYGIDTHRCPGCQP